MAQDIDIKLIGANELQQIFKLLPHKMQRNQFLKALRRAAKPIEQAAKANIGGYSKTIAQNIGSFPGKNNKVASIYTGVKVGRKSKGKDPWYSVFTEFGTKGIKRRRKQGYKRTENDNSKFSWFVGHIKPGNRFRKDQPAKPFMRPAIQANMPQSETIIQTELAGILLTAINKLNKRKTA